jgi:hypothetical protein
MGYSCLDITSFFSKQWKYVVSLALGNVRMSLGRSKKGFSRLESPTIAPREVEELLFRRFRGGRLLDMQPEIADFC